MSKLISDLRKLRQSVDPDPRGHDKMPELTRAINALEANATFMRDSAVHLECTPKDAWRAEVDEGNNENSDERYQKTTSWTPEQQDVIDAWVTRTADEIGLEIEQRRVALMALDERPKQTWSEAQPDVFMPYVAQGMLEDLIAELVSRV